MPESKTMERARRDQREGKSPSTQAGEFVREEIEHVRKGKHGARSAKQVIAIGLSKARRAGIKLPPPPAGETSSSTHAHGKHDYDRGQGSHHHRVSSKRSRATLRALKREGHEAASHTALARQAHVSARFRTAVDRSLAARKAARTRKQQSKVESMLAS